MDWLDFVYHPGRLERHLEALRSGKPVTPTGRELIQNMLNASLYGSGSVRIQLAAKIVCALDIPSCDLEESAPINKQRALFQQLATQTDASAFRKLELHRWILRAVSRGVAPANIIKQQISNEEAPEVHRDDSAALADDTDIGRDSVAPPSPVRESSPDHAVKEAETQTSLKADMDTAVAALREYLSHQQATGMLALPAYRAQVCYDLGTFFFQVDSFVSATDVLEQAVRLAGDGAQVPPASQGQGTFRMTFTLNAAKALLEACRAVATGTPMAQGAVAPLPAMEVYRVEQARQTAQWPVVMQLLAEDNVTRTLPWLFRDRLALSVPANWQHEVHSHNIVRRWLEGTQPSLATLMRIGNVADPLTSVLNASAATQKGGRIAQLSGLAAALRTLWRTDGQAASGGGGPAVGMKRRRQDSVDLDASGEVTSTTTDGEANAVRMASSLHLLRSGPDDLAAAGRAVAPGNLVAARTLYQAAIATNPQHTVASQALLSQSLANWEAEMKMTVETGGAAVASGQSLSPRAAPPKPLSSNLPTLSPSASSEAPPWQNAEAGEEGRAIKRRKLDDTAAPEPQVNPSPQLPQGKKDLAKRRLDELIDESLRLADRRPSLDVVTRVLAFHLSAAQYGAAQSFVEKFLSDQNMTDAEAPQRALCEIVRLFVEVLNRLRAAPATSGENKGAPPVQPTVEAFCLALASPYRGVKNVFDLMEGLINLTTAPPVLQHFGAIASAASTIITGARAEQPQAREAHQNTCWQSASRLLKHVTPIAQANEAILARMMRGSLERLVALYPLKSAWHVELGDHFLREENFREALRCYLRSVAAATSFLSLPPRDSGSVSGMDDVTLRRMITCCTELREQSYAAVLCQLPTTPDFALAFKIVNETPECVQSRHLEFFWDLSLLEILASTFERRRDSGKVALLMQIISRNELNQCNSARVLRQYTSATASSFLRLMAREFLVDDMQQ